MSRLGAVESILADRPDLLGRLSKLVDLAEDGRVDPGLLRLCRARVGKLLGCPAHAGEVPRLEDLDDRQRAVLAFAELFVMDHHSITDEDARRVTAHLSDAEMVTLTTALAVYDGFCRLEIQWMET